MKATERGQTPTSISATVVPVRVSMTETESLPRLQTKRDLLGWVLHPPILSNAKISLWMQWKSLRQWEVRRTSSAKAEVAESGEDILLLSLHRYTS